MANKQDVDNAFYEGMRVVISANRYDLFAILQNLDAGLIAEFKQWVRMEEPELADCIDNEGL